MRVRAPSDLAAEQRDRPRRGHSGVRFSMPITGATFPRTPTSGATRRLRLLREGGSRLPWDHGWRESPRARIGISEGEGPRAGKSADLHARPWRTRSPRVQQPRALRPDAVARRRAGGARDVAVANSRPSANRGGPAPQGDPLSPARRSPRTAADSRACAPPPRWPRPEPTGRARIRSPTRCTAAAPTAPGARPACTRRRTGTRTAARARSSSPGPPRPRGAPYLALARPVAVNRQLAAVRPTRGAASETPRRSHLRRRRHLRMPRLDVQPTSTNLLLAPLLQKSRSTTRRCPAKDRLRVTFL